MNSFWEGLKSITKWLVMLTAATPLIFSFSHVYAYSFPKMTWFMSLIEIALIFYAAYLAGIAWTKPKEWSEEKRKMLAVAKQPLFIAVLVMVAGMAVSAALGVDPTGSFYGNITRAEGLIAHLHYLAFIWFLAVLFSKKDWKNYLGISVGAGVIVAIYAWLQVGGVESVPFAQPYNDRPGSLIGNPNYMAAYLLLVLGIIAVMLGKRMLGRSVMEKTLLGGGGAIIISAIFISQGRGVILGLLVGLLIFLGLIWLSGGVGEKKVINGWKLRRLAAGGLLLIIVSGAGFWLTRSMTFWKGVPGLARVAELSTEDLTVATRVIGVKISLEALKERPIWGWGGDNYLAAFNRHYDPDFFLYEQAWFDRAHNKLAGTAVMYGVFGLLAYLAFLGIFGYEALKKREEGERAEIGSLALLGVLAAYGLQNLTAFDTPTSYIALYILAAWILFRGLADIETGDSREERAEVGATIKILVAVVGLGLVILSGYALYALRYIPFKQSAIYMKSLAVDSDEVMKNADKFLKPDNYLQPNLRLAFMQSVFDSGGATDERLFALADLAITALEESAAKDKYDPRPYQLLAEFYIERGAVDAQAYAKAEEHAKKGLKITAKRQSLAYLLGTALSAQDKHEEALKVFQEVYDLNPDQPQSNYYLGSAIAAARKEWYPEAKKYLERALELGIRMQEKDYSNYAQIYFSFEDWQALAKVMEEASRKYPNSQVWHKNAIVAYRGLRDAEGIIRHAEAMKELVGDQILIRDLNIIIQLAETKQWGVLDSIK